MKEFTIRTIMTENVVSVSTDTSLLKVKEYFETNHFHHLPVLNKSKEVVGIISRLDYNLVLDHFTIFGVPKANRSNTRFLGALIAKDVMSAQVVVIGADDKVAEAAKIFTENLFHALPVVEEGNLIGIVTTHDLLKHYGNLANQAKLPEGESGK